MTISLTQYACSSWPEDIPNTRWFQLRIDVSPDSESPSVHTYILGTPFSPASTITLPYPVVLTPRAKNAYYVKREGFNIVSMLSNPMMLIMGFTAIMMFAMPYIMVRFSLK